MNVIEGVDDEAIWNKHREELIRYASVLVGPADAEDLLSVVVVRILNRRRLADLDDPRSYLYRLVTHPRATVQVMSPGPRLWWFS